jgi:hypothetical protein
LGQKNYGHPRDTPWSIPKTPIPIYIPTENKYILLEVDIRYIIIGNLSTFLG